MDTISNTHTLLLRLRGESCTIRQEDSERKARVSGALGRKSEEIISRNTEVFTSLRGRGDDRKMRGNQGELLQEKKHLVVTDEESLN